MDKKKIGLVLAIIVLFITVSTPPQFGLTELGYKTLGILLIGLFLWILESMPLAVTALLVIILQPILGVSSLGEALSNFANPVTFSVLASFAISAAIVKTPLAHRLIKRLLYLSKNNSKKIILSFMIGTMVISSIMSNVSATALSMGLALGILAKMEPGDNKMRFGKVIMIAIPFAGMIGGLITPAASSINVITLNMMKELAGYQVSFLEWILYGFPIAVILLPSCWYVLIKLFKPQNIDQAVIDGFIKSEDVPEKMDKQEIKVAIIILTVMILWITGSWVPALDLTIVALGGMICFFLPGVDVLNWKEFSENVSWNAVIMIGGVISIGSATIKAELGQWFLSLFVDKLVQMPLFVLLIVMGIFLVLIKLLIPIGPAIITITAVPLYGLATIMNIPVEILFLPMAFVTIACLLVPLAAVPLITYSQGYYSMRDMFISGLITSLIWVVLTAVWVPFVGKMLGVL